MKAMILAAGRGKRLRPLTDSVPKPLIKVGGKCLIEYHLLALAKAGFKEVVINVAHLAQQIMDTLGNGQRFGLNILYSPEPEGGLETGGGIYNALPLLGSKPFLVMNGDIWTDYPLEKLKHLPGLAHLVLADNPQHNLKGDYSLKDNQVFRGEKNPYTMLGIYLCRPELFAECQPGIFRIPPLFEKPMTKGLITGEYYGGRWVDIGSIERLREAELLAHTSENISS